MIFVLSGSVGFVLLSVADALTLRGSIAGKRVAFCAAAVLEAAGMVGCAVRSPRLDLPWGLCLTGWVLGAISLFLLALSLLVSVPTARIYTEQTSDQRLVTTGLYSVVRHPGVPALALLLLSLVFVTGSRLLALAAPVWIAMDVGHVAWQEKHYLLVVHGEDYRRYQAEVPMVLPSLSGLRRVLASLRAPVRTSQEEGHNEEGQ